jgi:probable DNA polymerase
MRYLTLDFETYYDKDYSLSKKGMTTQDYIMSPKFAVLMASVKWGDGETQVVEAPDLPAFFASVDWAQTAVVNHNSVFDLSILWWRYGYRPALAVDTMSLAQCLGVPLLTGSASLAKCVQLLQEAGYELPSKGGEVVNALGKHRKDFTPAQWEAYKQYCKTDADITWFLFKVLKQYVSDDELAYQDIILRCYTEPRLKVHVPTVEYELARCRAYKAAQLAQVCEQLGCTQDNLAGVLRSNDKFAALLKAMGGITEAEMEQGAQGSFIIPTKVSATTGKVTWAFGKTDVGFKELCENELPFVQAICQARLAAKSSIDETRCEKFLDYASYGFLPMGYKIGGAHTNRMSGGSAGSANMQNLPSGRREGQSDLLRRSIIANDGQVIVNFDASQIECVAAGGLVLTDTGLKPIEHISIDDLLWDGIEWVEHDGVVMKGIKDVITYSGITATPDHIVYTECGRAIPFGQAAAERATLLVGEAGGKAIRTMDCAGQADTTNDPVHSSVLSLPMWSRTVGKCQRYRTWGFSWLRELHEQEVFAYTQAACVAVAAAVQRFGRTLQSKQVFFPNLCDGRKPLSILPRFRGVYVGGVPDAGLSRIGDRQDRYQRTLRAGQHSAGNARAKCTDAPLQYYGFISWVQDVGRQVRKGLCSALSRRCGSRYAAKRYDPAGDCTARGATQADVHRLSGCALYTGKVFRSLLPKLFCGLSVQPTAPRHDKWGNPITGTIPVYDIVNAGARHRFTYNGMIVSNCRVLNYIANQTDVLGVFASKGDVYSYTAAGVYGIPYSEINEGRKSSNPEIAAKYKPIRNYGKTCALALGYGQGAAGFQKYALVNSGINMSLDEAKRTVTAWRKANYAAAGFWKTCDQALQVMVDGGQMYFGGQDGKMFFADGKRFLLGRHVPGIRMPNGLWLNYPNLHVDMSSGKPQFVYDKMGYTGKPLKSKAYGGLICENIVQSLAFAIMKQQALWIAKYYPIVMNTHDEWCVVVPRDQAETAAEYMARCMRTAPDYVAGLPLDTEGGWAQSYGAVDDDWSKRPDNPDRVHRFDPNTGDIL